MTFKNWKIWLSQLPISLKWFAILVLIRPLVDLFYFLKNISPLISPLYIVGVLTPVIIGLSFISRKFQKKYTSFITDTNWIILGLLVILNLFFLFFIKPELEVFGDAVKLATPVFLFLYLRHFVNSKVNLIGLMQTMLYAAVIPALLMFYELAFEPINAEYLSENRGGGARIQGGFADIMTNAIYISAALLIQGYLTMRRIKSRNITVKNWVNVAIVVVVCFLGLKGIKQTSSWSVALFLVVLFFFYNLRNAKGFIIVLMALPIFVFFARNTFSEKIQPLVDKEFQVIEGERNLGGAFNGRMGRWIKYIDIWSEMPLSSNFLGVPISGRKESFVMVGSGIHNEFFRILFLTGIIGLALLLSFLIRIFIKVRHMEVPERFLVLGALGTFVLYSISTTPLVYAPLTYYLLAIFAYASLPKLVLKK